MTAPHPDDAADISSQEEFERVLFRILRAAHENDVDPRGSWVSRNGPSAPDWEVLITTLAKRDDTD